MIHKDRDTILDEINKDFEAIDLSSISPLSPARIMATNFSDEMSDMYSAVATIEEDLNPSKFSAEKLTEEGGKFGIERESVIPLADNTFTNFSFKLQGNFVGGDITLDKSKGFTIPGGTPVTGINGETFYTREDAEFDPDDNEVFVRIYSVSDTVNETIDVNTLTSHTINWADIVNVDPNLVTNVVLQCNNTKAIISESTRLTDDEMKALMQFEYNGLNQINENKALSAILRIPGVSDARIIENYNGVGSVAAVITPINPLASEGLYVAVERSLNRNVIGGSSIDVLRPEYLVVELTFSIELTDAVESTDSFYNELRFFISGLVNAIPQGDALNPDNIQTAVQETYSDELTSVKITCLTVNGNRALIQEQQAMEDQKFTIYDPVADIAIN